jgi:hypothetical protein
LLLRDGAREIARAEQPVSRPGPRERAAAESNERHRQYSPTSTDIVSIAAPLAFATRISLAVHTTRVPRPGTHAVDVLVNGQPARAGAFEVLAPRG